MDDYKHSNRLFLFGALKANVPDSSGLILTDFGCLRTDFSRRDTSGRKFSDRFEHTECSKIRQASTWPTIARGRWGRS